jgi:ubiquinone/menaquinone biosynthesis C-methylase UbiE
LAKALATRVAPDGDLLLVDESVDELERVLRSAPGPNVFYLVGVADVLPLIDGSVDAVLSRLAPSLCGPAEFFRVLRRGGRVEVSRSDQDLNGPALNLEPREVERLFSDSGFAGVTVASADGGLSVTAHRP